MRFRKEIIFGIICCCVLLMSGCGSTVTQVESYNNETSNISKSVISDKTNTGSENSNAGENGTSTTTNNENTNIDVNGLKDFAMKFVSIIKKDDSAAFKRLVDKYGLFSITYFTDQRDPNVAIHLFKDEIRDDLVLANSHKAGITVDIMFDFDDGFKKNDMPVNISQDLSNISFNVDWKTNDERVITKQLEDIIKTCQKINLTNNEYIPQIFVLKDNIYAFAQSNGVLEPEPDFTGDWVIFEKVGNEYYLRALMQLQ